MLRSEQLSPTLLKRVQVECHKIDM